LLGDEGDGDLEPTPEADPGSDATSRLFRDARLLPSSSAIRLGCLGYLGRCPASKTPPSAMDFFLLSCFVLPHQGIFKPPTKARWEGGWWGRRALQNKNPEIATRKESGQACVWLSLEQTQKKLRSKSQGNCHHPPYFLHPEKEPHMAEKGQTDRQVCQELGMIFGIHSKRYKGF